MHILTMDGVNVCIIYNLYWFCQMLHSSVVSLRPLTTWDSLYSCNYHGIFTTLCILLYISDVALQIVKSERWKEALRNITDNNGVVDTPLRKLIRKMPG